MIYSKIIFFCHLRLVKEIIFQELVIGKMNIKIKDGEKLKLQDKFDVIYFECHWILKKVGILNKAALC